MHIETEITRFPGKEPKMSVRDRVLAVIAQEIMREVQPEQLDSRFEELGVDSLDKVCILFGLEKEFGVSITEDQARTFATVRELIGYFERDAEAQPEAAVAA